MDNDDKKITYRQDFLYFAESMTDILRNILLLLYEYIHTLYCTVWFLDLGKVSDIDWIYTVIFRKVIIRTWRETREQLNL